MCKNFSLPLRLLFVFTACFSCISHTAQNRVAGLVTDSPGAGFTFVHLPPLALQPSGVNLKEVSMTAIKKVIGFKNGMTVLNVENSIMASGNTVLDISAARYMISAANTIF